MSVDTTESVFRFSEGFDALFLNDLYGDDLAVAAEVFGSSALRIRETIYRAGIHLQAREWEQVRSSIHHIKPLFGYTGLTGLQKSVEAFESSCQNETDRNLLAVEFLRLEKEICEACVKIVEEHNRLKAQLNPKE
jgi:hypothetical protein